MNITSFIHCLSFYHFPKVIKANEFLAIHDGKDMKSTTFHIKQQEENNSRSF